MFSVRTDSELAQKLKQVLVRDGKIRLVPETPLPASQQTSHSIHTNNACACPMEKLYITPAQPSQPPNPEPRTRIPIVSTRLETLTATSSLHRFPSRLSQMVQNGMRSGAERGKCNKEPRS
ncbi:hypothetical protein M758_7G067300 [Ceratodon purpureus]|nr:hypothetical protein M758_7G067300 [Ceratodon purpureus]